MCACNSVDGVNADQSALEIRITRKTAPGPVAGMIDQLPFQRIHVHVMKFFDSLPQTPHVEIVEAALPEAAKRIVAARKWQTKLSGRVALLAAQAARDALL